MKKRDYFKSTNGSFKLTNGEKISLCALLVSLTSILFNIYQFRSISERNNEHDKLAMRPILSCEYQYDDSLGRIVLSNKGTGPAFIKSYRLVYKNTDYKRIFQVYRRYDSVRGPKSFWGFAFDSGFIVLPSESRDIIRIPKQDLINISSDSTFQLKFKYSDIYQDTFFFNF